MSREESHPRLSQPQVASLREHDAASPPSHFVVAEPLAAVRIPCCDTSPHQDWYRFALREYIAAVKDRRSDQLGIEEMFYSYHEALTSGLGLLNRSFSTLQRAEAVRATAVVIHVAMAVIHRGAIRKSHVS